VGDFDAVEVQKLATELFGEWKSPVPFTQVKRDWKKIEAVDRSIETPDKANAVFLAILTMPSMTTIPITGAVCRQYHARQRSGIAFVGAHPRKGRIEL